MTIIRAYALERDAEGVAVLAGEVWHRPVPVQDILEHERTAPAGRIAVQLVAESGGVVAYGNAIRDPANPAGLFQVDVVVTAGHRRRGLGSALLTRVERFAVEHGATRLGAVVPGFDEDTGTAFAARHGYRVVRRAYHSYLTVADVDPGLLAEPDPPGVEVTTLAALGDGEQARRTLWDVHERTVPDMPGSRTAARRPYAEFAEAVLGRRWFRADGAFLAFAGGVAVGLAIVSFQPESDSMNHTFTGVLPEWRGRGVASALKRATIRYARQVGVATMRAGNDAANAPMLAINARFGYQRRGGHVRLEKTVPPSPLPSPPDAGPPDAGPPIMN
ncbi:MAG: GNAT family N-acetyltransferase [Hamadaea sp.]|nr:GNAT family N-acetyltransferase [Hamadaea sp.]NUT05647.1 GNAT family N-acetyltransferase [Hamadaea sp.]